MNNFPPLVILGYGNPSRGDDALGPILLHQLLEYCDGQSLVKFVEDFQLQVEHALDLTGNQLALFIDASISQAPPFGFSRLQATQALAYTTHAMHPSTILHIYEHTFHTPAPPAFLLSIRGESFELGAPLSAAAERHLNAAFAWVQDLCAHPEVTAWEAKTRTC